MQVPIKDTTQPSEVKAIFYQDETLDAYTFVLDHMHTYTHEMLGTSENGTGFSQFITGVYFPKGKNEHLGKPIEWEQVNDTLKNHVKYRVESGV